MTCSEVRNLLYARETFHLAFCLIHSSKHNKTIIKQAKRRQKRKIHSPTPKIKGRKNSTEGVAHFSFIRRPGSLGEGSEELLAVDLVKISRKL